MYGAPPSIGALKAYFAEQERQEAWRAYMADMTCSVFRVLRPKSQMPFYSDIIRKMDAPKDSRTGHEIVQDLAKKLRKRKAAREVKKQNETV